ncbi:type 4a pilus biogenesis protein PilO [Candidatus Daviesbacteria bacterium]|nr:type 4a pilus biogenesis protein PilO [Candidatus Daviesbacteria bacterium]
MTSPNKNSRYFTYIKPVTKIPVIRTYGTTVITFAAMSIFLLFAIKPTIETILTLQIKLEDSREILKQVTQKAENLSLGKQNYDNLNTQLKTKIQSAIPGNITYTTLIQTFELSSKTYDATISAIQIQPLTIPHTTSTKFDNTLSEVSFTVNIEGPYEPLLKILAEIQKSPRLISIDDLIINKGSEESSNLLMSITGKAYYLR